MKFKNLEMSKTTFIYGAIFSLANRMQAIGDKIDPTVSTKQWFVLAAVFQFGEKHPNIGDVAQLLGTSRQNIKKIAAILERKGYMKLKKDPNDLRNIQLFLTNSCFKYFKSREKQENEYLESIFFGINAKQLDALCTGMSKLIENIDQMLDDSTNTERQEQS